LLTEWFAVNEAEKEQVTSLELWQAALAVNNLTLTTFNNNNQAF
jgi:hypothetical protein